MNKLSIAKRAQILGLLVESNSLRSTSRLANVSINTVTKLLVDVGTACSEYQDKTLRNLPCKRVQIDEIWSFVYAKERSSPAEMKASGQADDIWTWTAIDADTKLVPSWLVGDRNLGAGRRFTCDLASRMANRIQLTSLDHRIYLDAVEKGFGGDVDYAMLVKHYGQSTDDERGYIPPQVIGTSHVCCTGKPDVDHVSTSFVERQNHTMRMSMRRFMRLTNAFSRKVKNHEHAVALHFMYYNFGRIHKSLCVTPAMAAGVTDHTWSLEEIAQLAS